MTDPTPQPALDRLVRRLSLLIGAATRQLERNPTQVAQWEEEISRQLARYHSAAYLAGAKANDLTPAARTAVQRDLRTQLDFLSQFALEIQEAVEWQAGWNARAEMYAGGIAVPYWRGKTNMLPLPAMPGESGQCLTRCRCVWDVQRLDGEENYDCYWRLGSSRGNCQTCLQRSEEWAPLQIRNGELQ